MKLFKETKHILKLTVADLLTLVPKELENKPFLIQLGNGHECLQAVNLGKSVFCITFTFEE